MRTSSRSDAREGRVAFLWDDSFLWGVMASKALRAAGLPFEYIRAEDIRQGRLSRCTTLFVPGGWASNKLKALGEEGAANILQFVREGGSYIGFCGGAGLATQDGIDLLPIRRRPTKERVPSFSGRIRLSLNGDPLWRGIDDPVFHAWWPSQFVVDGGVDVLATYGEALPDSFSSDVNVGDAQAACSWTELEEGYQINLDPKRLSGSPALIRGECGAGKVLLSLVHFDTPGDRNGVTMLQNIWRSFCGVPASASGEETPGPPGQERRTPTDDDLDELERAVTGLIELGKRNFLWYWRHPLLLQWRRGVRGLEYCTLSVLVRELQEIRKKREWPSGSDAGQERIRTLAMEFEAKARELLVRERFALQQSHITYERCDDPQVQALRDVLFSRSKSHGGLFKVLVDEIDRLLYLMMTSR